MMVAQRRLLLLLVKVWIAIALVHFSIDHVDVMRGDFSALDIAACSSYIDVMALLHIMLYFRL